MKTDDFFKGKDILVTGGCGSIGSEIVKKLITLDVSRVRSFDNNESGQYHLQEENAGNSKLRTLIGDIRDKERVRVAMKGVDIVFHAAALKHVPMCEYNPFEAVATNVYGTQNVIRAARENGVKRFISISTDKAVNPINTMGATKLLSEKIVLNAPLGDDVTMFSCVRFGNVLNSSGSVIPLFLKQIRKGGPVTLTCEEMTRFFMSTEDAVNLILKTSQIMKGREIFILKMKALRISDLASVMIEEIAPKNGMRPSDIKILKIGIRPGEKIHESLMTEEERLYSEETEDMYIIRPGISSPHYTDYLRNPKVSAGNSNGNLLTAEEVRQLIRNTVMKEIGNK